jgi:membrane peptidoglycan carboxypeptidase
MRGVVGGSLPANIWKDFMEQADATMAEAAPMSGSVSSAFASEDGAAPAAETQSAQCNIPACQGSYRSFRASDCTYQPYWDGPRQYCER